MSEHRRARIRGVILGQGVGVRPTGVSDASLTQRVKDTSPPAKAEVGRCIRLPTAWPVQNWRQLER